MTIKYLFGVYDYVGGTEFEYEVDWKDLKTAFDKILKNIAKVKDGENEAVERLMKFLIDDVDIWGIEYLQEQLEDELKEYFMQDAFEAYYESEGYYNGSDDYYRDKI